MSLLKKNTNVCCKSSICDFVTYFCSIRSFFAGSALSYEFELKSGENIYYIQMHILKYINTSSKSISMELCFVFVF